MHHHPLVHAYLVHVEKSPLSCRSTCRAADVMLLGWRRKGVLAAWAETGRGKRRGKIADDAPAFTNYIHHQEGHEAVDQEGEEGAEAVGYVT